MQLFIQQINAHARHTYQGGTKTGLRDLKINKLRVLDQAQTSSMDAHQQETQMQKYQQYRLTCAATFVTMGSMNL